MIITEKREIIKLNNGDFLLVNLLSGNTVKIKEEILAKLENLDNISISNSELFNKLVDGKFIFESKEDEEIYYQKLICAINKKELNETPNFTILFTYDCNLDCGYCYEKSLPHPKGFLGKDHLAAMKSFILENSNGYNPSKVRIAITGGEPLLQKNYNIVKEFLQFTYQKGFLTHIITNGTELIHFADIISKYKVDSIQVTIDGTKEIHDSRRYYHNKKGSFDNIIRGIDACISNNINVYIRVNVDNLNIENISKLGDFLIQKYEYSNFIHPYIYLLKDEGCMKEDLCLSETVAVKMIVTKRNLKGIDYFNLSFHGGNFIESTFGIRKFIPFTRFCSACRNQFVLSPDGNIYKCWFGVGDTQFAIGSYYPKTYINNEEINLWKERSICNISQCSVCKYAFICGGGCANRAIKKKNSILTPNCADFKELLELGFNYYINKTESK